MSLISLFFLSHLVLAAQSPSIQDNVVPGEVLVRTRDPGVLKMLRSRSISFDSRAMTGFDGLFHLKLRDPGLARAALTILQRDPRVLYAEPNRWITLASSEEETQELWGLKSIELFPVWESGLRGKRSIIVGVLDTGIDWTHPDLAANTYSNPGELPDNGIDDDGNGFTDDMRGWNFVNDTPRSLDDHKHGTHVAGIIGAVGGNGIGIAGVAWEVSLLPLKFMDERGRGKTDDAIEAIAYATRMGAKIINCSFTSRAPSKALEDAVRAAGENGVTLVAAAGNDKFDIDSYPMYPASYSLPSVITVAAYDQTGNLAEFSNHGAKSVHVAAPGVSIVSTLPGGSYGPLNGTSMAAPHVTGLAALLLSQDPTLSPAEIKDRIVRSSVRKSPLRRKVAAGGTIQAWNAAQSFYPPSIEPADSDWVRKSKSLASSHPYRYNENLALAIHEPGARFLRVHFTRYQVEVVHDSLTLETPAGEVQELLQGEAADFVSDYVDGDTLVLRLRSDLMTNKWGFEIDRVEAVY